MFRRSHFFTPLLAVVALLIPALSHAQRIDTQDRQANPGKVSVGLNLGALIFPGGSIPVLGPNITFNSSRRSGLEISSSLMRENDDYSRDTMILYAVQYRRTFKDVGDSRSYWSVGGAGFIDRYQSKSHQYGSSNQYTSSAQTHTWAIAPVAPVFGIGTEKFVTPRLAVRGDVLISYLVMRAAVGVSVPLGHLK